MNTSRSSVSKRVVQAGADGFPPRNALALGVFEITTQVGCKVFTLNKEDNGKCSLLLSGENVPIFGGGWGGVSCPVLSRVPLTTRFAAGNLSLALNLDLNVNLDLDLDLDVCAWEADWPVDGTGGAAANKVGDPCFVP